MSAYPVLHEAEYIEKRSRLSVLFRAVLLIPNEHPTLAAADGGGTLGSQGAFAPPTGPPGGLPG